MTIVQVILPMNTADSMVTDMNIHHIIECFSPSSVTFVEDRFLSFQHLIIHLFKNDLDSTDNSNSVSSFPMIHCCGLAPLRGITTGCPVLSRGITSFNGLRCSIVLGLLMKETWFGIVCFHQDVTTGCTDLSHIEVSVFHS